MGGVRQVLGLELDSCQALTMASNKHLVFSLSLHFPHMVSDVFGGKNTSYDIFLVETIIMKGTIPQVTLCTPRMTSPASDTVITFPPGIRSRGLSGWDNMDFVRSGDHLDSTGGLLLLSPPCDLLLKAASASCK